MILTDKAQIKAASLKESDKLRLTTSDELECYELIESDLKLPADATFTRSSVAYLSDGTQATDNQPRFEQGKFGKAILVEEGTENLLTANQSSVETDLTGITANYPDVTITRDTTVRWQGNASTKVVCSNSSNYRGIRIGPLSLTAGTTYTFSAYVRGNVGGETVMLAVAKAGPWQANSQLITLTTTFQRIILTWTCSTTASNYYLEIGQHGNTSPTTFYYDGGQVEAKPYATSFIDGIRSSETLTIPTTRVLNPQEGTVEFRLKPLIVKNYNNFFSMAVSNGRFLLFFDNSGMARFDYGPLNSGPTTPGGTITVNNWYYIVLRWSATTGKQALFINGVKYEYTLPNGVATSFPSTVSVVNNYSAYIDDLRISNKARSDEEILAAYQNNLPLLADVWTTYKLDFDDKIRITTQGQIICNELIEI